MTLPTRIEAGGCPGGLVAVVFDVHDVEVERSTLGGNGHRGGVAGAAARHAGRVRDNGGQVVIYDGDTGRAVVLLLADAVIVLGGIGGPT